MDILQAGWEKYLGAPLVQCVFAPYNPTLKFIDRKSGRESAALFVV